MRALLGRIEGWPRPGVPVGLVANSMWGINYGVALDALHTGLVVDPDKTGERITRLYVGGIPRFRAAP